MRPAVFFTLALFVALRTLGATEPREPGLTDEMCFGKRSIYHLPPQDTGRRDFVGPTDRLDLTEMGCNFVKRTLDKAPWSNYSEDLRNQLEELCQLQKENDENNIEASVVIVFNGPSSNVSSKFNNCMSDLPYGFSGWIGSDNQGATLIANSSINLESSNFSSVYGCLANLTGLPRYDSRNKTCNLTIDQVITNLTIPQHYVNLTARARLDGPSSTDYFWCQVTNGNCSDIINRVCSNSRQSILGTGMQNTRPKNPNDKEEAERAYCGDKGCDHWTAKARVRRSDRENSGNGKKTPPKKGPFQKIKQLFGGPGSSSSSLVPPNGDRAQVGVDGVFHPDGRGGPVVVGIGADTLGAAGGDILGGMRQQLPSIPTDKGLGQTVDSLNKREGSNLPPPVDLPLQDKLEGLTKIGGMILGGKEMFVKDPGTPNERIVFLGPEQYPVPDQHLGPDRYAGPLGDIYTRPHRKPPSSPSQSFGSGGGRHQLPSLTGPDSHVRGGSRNPFPVSRPGWENPYEDMPGMYDEVGFNRHHYPVQVTDSYQDPRDAVQQRRGGGTYRSPYGTSDVRTGDEYSFAGPPGTATGRRRSSNQGAVGNSGYDLPGWDSRQRPLPEGRGSHTYEEIGGGDGGYSLVGGGRGGPILRGPFPDSNIYEEIGSDRGGPRRESRVYEEVGGGDGVYSLAGGIGGRGGPRRESRVYEEVGGGDGVYSLAGGAGGGAPLLRGPRPDSHIYQEVGHGPPSPESTPPPLPPRKKNGLNVRTGFRPQSQGRPGETPDQSSRSRHIFGSPGSPSSSSSSSGGRRSGTPPIAPPRRSRCRRSAVSYSLLCGVSSATSSSGYRPPPYNPDYRAPHQTDSRFDQLHRGNRDQHFLGGAFVGSMLSFEHQTTITKIRNGDYNTGDRAQDVSAAVGDLLNRVGSMVSGTGMMIGSPHVMIAGLAGQAMAGLIDLGMIIRALITGEHVKPPPDPIAEMYSTYAKYMSSNEAGARLCLLPDSRLTVTVAYRHRGTDTEAGEKSLLHASDTVPSIVQYLSTDLADYTAQVEVICPRGTLRLLQGDISQYILQDYAGTDQAKHYYINAMKMVSSFPNATLTCGSEEGLYFVPYKPDPSDFQLLDRTGIGEPDSLRKLPSNVCDLFPFKRFYFLTSGCEYNRGQVAMSHTTCSVLLRRSLWDEKHQRWFAPDPFAHPGSDVKVFTFSRYDFPEVPLKPNEIPGHDDYCTVRNGQICYFSEPMVLDDQYTCRPRSRRLYVEIAPIGSTGFYTAFVLTCPWLSTPVVQPPWAPVTRVNVGQSYTSAMFAFSAAGTAAYLYCQHNTDKRLKSDMVVLSAKSPDDKKTKFDTNTWCDVKTQQGSTFLVDKFQSRFYKASKTCTTSTMFKRNMIDWGYNNNWLYVTYPPAVTLDAVVKVIKQPRVILSEYASPADLNEGMLERVGKYYPGSLYLTYDVTGLEEGYMVNKHFFWENAKKHLRTYSSLAVMIFACEVRNGRYVKKDWETIDDVVYFPFDDGWGSDGYYFFPTWKNLCQANISIADRRLHVTCKSYSIKIGIKQRQLCVSLTTSIDHCNGDASVARRGYLRQEAVNGFSRNYGYNYNLGSSSAHFQHLYCFSPSMYLDRIIMPKVQICRSFVMLFYQDLEIESEHFTPPPYPTTQFLSPNDTIIPASMYRTVLELKDLLDELMDYSRNPLIREINNFAQFLTDGGRQIARVTVDGDLLETSYLARQELIAQLEDAIRAKLVELVDLIIDRNEARARQRAEEHSVQECCILDPATNTSSKTFPDGYYLCGNYSDFIIDYGGVRYLIINDTLEPEGYVLYAEETPTTCLDMMYYLITNDKERAELEELLSKLLIEDAIQTLFDEYDRNFTEIIENFYNETMNETDGGHGDYDDTPETGGGYVGVAVGVSVSCVLLGLAVLLLLVVYVYRRRIGVYSVEVAARFTNKSENDTVSLLRLVE
ncbi:B22R-like protein [Nile crocodilepox virus]|uniref:B22R-like protein n=1 Tax=Nile crocodilepox virus (isolate Crocodylus niloticus/Zimbabwe/Ume/2001) TaxID=1289473 RepID=Q070K9_CPRVZ|nr:B22R-like protein [Nile crocodilepox virus]ABJ08934.1 B22R-like protein [Nile crocodilepox virus]